MESFEALLEYANRQVILNVYRGDDLLQRDGYAFDCIRMTRDRLLIIKSDVTVAEAKLSPSTKLVRLPDFPRYYAFELEEIRTELYFP
jgi:hypothetical protein